MSIQTSELTVFTKGASGVKKYTLDELGIYNNLSVRYFPEYRQIQGSLLAASVDAFVAGFHDGTWAVASVFEAHTVVGGSSAAFNVVVCPQHIAIASGTAQLSAGLDLTTTAPNAAFGTLIASPTPLARGDVLGLDFSGTLTGLVGVYDIVLKRIG